MEKTILHHQFLKFGEEAGAAVALLRAMANECRLLVLCHLATDGELNVGQLAERVGLSQSALSQHLAKLREERLVATRQGGADGILPPVRPEGGAGACASP